MTDLHALLNEQSWCTQCHFDHCEKKYGICPGELMPPLATRMPEAVPAGLYWEDELWWLSHDPITDEQAELLFIGNALKILTGGKPSVYIHASCDPTRMAAALHRLCDERDAAKETTDA